MEDKEFIEKLIKSRKLQSETNEDWEVYELVEEEIFRQDKVRDLEIYFYGFDDETFGDSVIFYYLECVFYDTRVGAFGNKYTETQIIEKFIGNFEIFNPHAIDWYALIIQHFLAHFSENTLQIMNKAIMKLSNNRRKVLGKLLKDAKSGIFQYDDMDKIVAQYESFITLCES